MIYITGDTHGEFGRFPGGDVLSGQRRLLQGDYVIVCGDFGLCWAKDKEFEYHCDFFAKKPFTLLWVQGNHENYDMIAEYPIEEWHGGKVRHIVRDKVILLERGQVFDIDGKSFFTFGGAASHDVQGGILNRNDCDFDYERRKAIDADLPFRIVHESWWKEELPNEEEMDEGRKNLAIHEYKVDYVITHCCATDLQTKLDRGPGHVLKPDVLTEYLQELEEKIQYEHWYFGHYHLDEKIDEKHTVLYYGVIPLTEELDENIRVPLIGQPVFMRGEMVNFYWREIRKTGEVQIVDAYGTFEQNEEPSYDVYVKEDNCLYKHIRESSLRREI